MHVVRGKSANTDGRVEAIVSCGSHITRYFREISASTWIQNLKILLAIPTETWKRNARSTSNNPNLSLMRVSKIWSFTASLQVIFASDDATPVYSSNSTFDRPVKNRNFLAGEVSQTENAVCVARVALVTTTGEIGVQYEWSFCCPTSHCIPTSTFRMPLLQVHWGARVELGDSSCTSISSPWGAPQSTTKDGGDGGGDWGGAWSRAGGKLDSALLECTPAGVASAACPESGRRGCLRLPLFFATFK